MLSSSSPQPLLPNTNIRYLNRTGAVVFAANAFEKCFAIVVAFCEFSDVSNVALLRLWYIFADVFIVEFSSLVLCYAVLAGVFARPACWCQAGGGVGPHCVYSAFAA